MGNINMNNLICDNYYCQSVSFKPEWLSENNWNISYIHLNENLDTNLNTNLDTKSSKPYIIDKGILKIKNTHSFNLLLSKKLLVNFNDVQHISIPINFKFNLTNNSDINLFIIFSNKELLINNILEQINNEESFYIKLLFKKKSISLLHSFDTNILKNNIKSNKIYTFNIDLENNYNMMLIKEKIDNILNEKYLFQYNINATNNYYLNLYIDIKNNLNENEYLELNFE